MLKVLYITTKELGKGLFLAACYWSYLAVRMFTSNWWDIWAYTNYMDRSVGILNLIFYPIILLFILAIPVFFFKNTRSPAIYTIYKKLIPLVWLYPLMIIFTIVIAGIVYNQPLY